MVHSTFHHHTPIGWLQITDNGRAITHIQLCRQANIISVSPKTSLQILVSRQLNDYFVGQRHSFDVPIEPQGTAFQQHIWTELRNIPYGQTRTYSDIARHIGCPQAARAVGNACNRNPILLLIPCHRVVGKNQHLTGFSAGLFNKQKLLLLEQRFIAPTQMQYADFFVPLQPE
ncbi:MAG: methylated-DNA--[protein]-cysteine S-methyltransferase [Paludibacteraceae bacterium]